ncbi:hypothetical protein CLF_112955 [Clonorchis sinensis]|uniref:Uncharacterized protein n=1 Tax=Clonorchis sinensis TaxID=79923 RepID=G7YXC0_CLOSI|nr:hypothetical protein CLF_112955 [Clonorchis sinensis]
MRTAEDYWFASSMSLKLPRDLGLKDTMKILFLIFCEQSTLFSVRYYCLKITKDTEDVIVHAGHTKDVTLIGRVRRAATKMVAGLKSVDYEARLAVIDLFTLEHRRLRGGFFLTYAMFAAH